MERKKITIIVVAVILAITAVYFGAVFIKKSATEKKNQSAENEVAKKIENAINKALPKITCDFASDGEANAKAIDTKDIAYCSCVKEEKRKGVCRTGVMDINYYDQAIAQYDEEICKNIQTELVKQACVGIASSGAESLKSSNPKQLASTYLNNGNYQKAENIFSGLLNANPEDISILLNAALNYANRALFEHKEATFIPQALSLVDKAEKLAPNNPEVFRVKGFVFEIKPELQSAIISYTKAIELNAKYIPAYVGRGHARNLMGLLEEALKDFKKAKELDVKKENIDVYANLCRLEASRSDLMESAIEDCQTALNFKEENPIRKSETLEILAEMYIKSGRIDEAKVNADKALTFSPNDPNALYTQAQIDNIQGRYAEAEAISRKIISIDPQKTIAYNALAFALYSQQKYDEAIKSAQTGLSVIDKDESLMTAFKNSIKKELYLNLYNAYGMKGDEGKAQEYKKMADNL